ncbi:MAG: hypothetical protein M0R46_11125 [Candidatus Muirbacterium halophilum]|nr:hypothetical protein [Candidatus Muirbacterium halophilum]MCK9476466.1 hypothetical protein [Candidatus Muirbacterium halophilum]
MYKIIYLFLFIIIFNMFFCHADNIFDNSLQKNLTLKEFVESIYNKKIICFGIDTNDDYNFRIVYEIISILKQRMSHLCVYSDIQFDNKFVYSDKLLKFFKNNSIELKNISFNSKLKKKIEEFGVDKLNTDEKILIPYYEEDFIEKKYYFEKYKLKIPEIRRFNMSLFCNYYNSILIEKEFIANNLQNLIKNSDANEKIILIFDKDKVLGGFGVLNKINRKSEYSNIRIIPVYYENISNVFKSQNYSDIIWIIKSKLK